MKIIFFGSGAFGVPTLRALAGAAGMDVVRVVTQPDRPAGRGKKSRPTPIRAYCAEHGIPVDALRDVNDAEAVHTLLEIGARLGVVVAFGQKIGPGILDGLPGGCVNLHASLLPRYRGAAPIQWAILNGEPETGVTVFRLVERMDAGPILTSAATVIGERETAGELHDRLAELGPGAVIEALGTFEGNETPAGEVQNETQATAARKLRKSDGVIDWSTAAEEVVRRVHGLCPWPGATTTFVSSASGRSEAVTILRARAHERARAGAPGTLTEEFFVYCIRGEMEIEEIRPAGGRAMSWRDFANGRRVSLGDRFGGATPET